MKPTMTVCAADVPCASTRAAAEAASAAAMRAIAPNESAPRVQRPVITDPPRVVVRPRRPSPNLRPDSGLVFYAFEGPRVKGRGQTRRHVRAGHCPGV